MVSPRFVEQNAALDGDSAAINLRQFALSLGIEKMSYRERGDLFARRVGEYLAMLGYDVRPEYPVEVGLSSRHKKSHCFDYGNQEVLVECKCYDWTAGGNNPSAKIATLNEAMMYFHSVSELYEKRIFISKTERKASGVLRLWASITSDCTSILFQTT